MTSHIGFQREVLETVLGGVSAIDIPRLTFESLDEVHRFIKAYGYDFSQPGEEDRVWALHMRAITFIRENLLKEGETFPDEISDRSGLKDVGRLMLMASNNTDARLQPWACGVLRVMHVLAHIDNDIFIEHSDLIQDQVLKNFRSHLTVDEATGTFLGRRDHVDQIQLKKFEIKPFKATGSSIVKLLSKPQAVAFTLLDKMGVRFVTKSVFDAFRVVRFLVEEHIVSYPNIMPDQGRNNLYPVNLFLEVISEMNQELSPEEIEREMKAKIELDSDRANFLERKNEFSSEDYRAIKFIARHLIDLPSSERSVRFFFPYEVQIVDYETYVKNLSGASSHDEYKRRQVQAARLRVFGTAHLRS